MVIIGTCLKCRAGPLIYLSDITLGHNSRIAHLTRWTFSDTCLFCGFSCNSCKLSCVWKISSQFYLIVFNIFLVMIIIVNINTSIWSCSWASRKTLVCTYFGCLLSVSYTVFVLTFCQKSVFSYINTPRHVLVHKWKVMQMHLHNPAHAVKDLTADWT